MPGEWWNGIHEGLKILWSQGREGSTPSLPTFIIMGRQLNNIGWALLCGVIFCATALSATTGVKEFSAGGVSVTYPENWSERNDIAGVLGIFLSPQEDAKDIFQENVNILSQDLTLNPAIQELSSYTEFSQTQIESFLTEGKILSLEDVTLAGLPAKKMLYTSKQGQVTLQYLGVWMIKEKKAYVITYTALQSQFDRYLPQAQAVINSFKLSQ